MSRISPESILNKFKFMERYLNQLKKYQSISQENYVNSFDAQLAVERLIQLIVQVGIDVNFYILKQLKVKEPENSADTVFELARLGILEAELAFRLSESIRMRNLLVHLYEDIEPKIVHASIQDIFYDYPQYQEQITEYINSLEVENG